MKFFLAGIVLILVFPIMLFAQGDFGIPSTKPKEVFNLCNSAPPASGTVTFNVDIIDTLNEPEEVIPMTSSKIYISTNNQANWTGYDISNIGGTGYENTYYYDYLLPIASGTFYYYFQVGTDSTVTSQAPKNSSETFPPPNNLMANIHDDPAGDDLPIVLDATHNWENTDLRNFKLGYSDNKMYIQITSNGGFATVHSHLLQLDCFFDKYVDVYHLYAAPIINPQAEFNDSIFYAVIYGDLDISFLGIGITITPGVYKIINPGEGAGIADYLDAYEKISDGSNYGYNIAGNVLNMWFDISLLTSDPHFGPLPDDNGILTGCGIASAFMAYKECLSLVTDTFAYVVNDFSRNTGFYMTTLSDVVDENTAFSLSGLSSDATAESIDISITYNDGDNNLPTIHQIEIGGCYPGIYDMYAYDHSYDDGSVFVANIAMPNPYKVPYRFIFSDGMYFETTAWDTINTGLEIYAFEVNGLEEVAISLDTISCKDTVILETADSIRVENQGSVPIDLGLRVISISDADPPISFSVAGEAGKDTFAVRAIFNESSTAPAGSAFDDVNNYLSDVIIWATETIFGDGGFHLLPMCYNGGFASDEDISDKLWLKFVAPRYSSHSTEDMNLTMQIEMRSRVSLP